ncbi:MAG: DNA-binding response regulator [Marinilabiliales bacterium]|nr:MAG: DNA-binding response regulator [Marinilabiliales bacterium]
MVTAVIIDDEKHARLTLRQLIRSFLSERLMVVDTASSVAEGVKSIKKHEPDIVFLDIEMPVQNGFSLFSHFDEIHFRVVFCTAYEQYAIDAIRVAAFDYLLKPVSQDDLMAFMDRYDNFRVSPLANRTRINTLISNLSGDGTHFNSIALPTKDGYQMEKVVDIVYCRARESYCEVHVKGQISYFVSRTLKQMEEILPPELFFRIHKSFLVNLNYVKIYRKPENYIILHNGQQLEVAHRRSDEFLRRLTRRS